MGTKIGRQWEREEGLASEGMGMGAACGDLWPCGVGVLGGSGRTGTPCMGVDAGTSCERVGGALPSANVVIRIKRKNVIRNIYALGQ